MTFLLDFAAISDPVPDAASVGPSSDRNASNGPAFHLRSKAALRQAPRRHFCDPSLAVAVLGGSPDRLLKDLEWLGLLFESLVIRDLRVLAQALDGELFHYRDDYGVEVDAIVQLRDGRWGAIEIKLGPGQVEAAAAGLLRFRQQIDTRRTRLPGPHHACWRGAVSPPDASN